MSKTALQTKRKRIQISKAEFHFEGKKLDILEIAEGLINEW